MGRRAILLPSEAKTEGVRMLREVLLRQTFGQVARRLRCDASAVGRYAREERSPHPSMRDRFASELGIPLEAWLLAPRVDAYGGDAPATTKREPPETQPRGGPPSASGTK